MPESPGIALLGLGRIGRLHLHALKSMGEARLVAVAEPQQDPIRAWGHLLNGVRVYPTATDVLSHPGVDACIIATPTDLHVEATRLALSSGQHVFCEKPLALDIAESERLGETAIEMGLTLQVGFWRRFCRPLVEAKRLLLEGTIGPAISVRCVQWDVSSPPARWCDPKRSGGVFIDMGVHEFDQIEWLLEQSITEIESRPLARVEKGLSEVGDYDNAQVLLRVDGGATATIDLSRNGRYADDIRLEILGRDGAIFAETWPYAQVRLGTRDGLTTIWRGGAQNALLAGITAELRAFVACMLGTASEEVPGASESARAVALGLAAGESAAQQGRIIRPA